MEGWGGRRERTSVAAVGSTDSWVRKRAEGENKGQDWWERLPGRDGKFFIVSLEIFIVIFRLHGMLVTEDGTCNTCFGSSES